MGWRNRARGRGSCCTWKYDPLPPSRRLDPSLTHLGRILFRRGVGVVPSPSILSQLKPPATMAELGDSLGVVNGLMSSLAVILALQTLVSQRRDSMRAGEEQAKYQEFLLEQLTIQTLTSRQSYLMGEEERLQGILDRTAGELRHEQLRGNVMRRKSRVLSELKDVEETLRDRLYR